MQMLKDSGFVLRCEVVAYVRTHNSSGFPDKDAVKALLHKLVDQDAIQYICQYGIWHEVE